jgi:hypothetical protein
MVNVPVAPGGHSNRVRITWGRRSGDMESLGRPVGQRGRTLPTGRSGHQDQQQDEVNA